MSVINKMLRDLDSRQAQGTVAVPGSVTGMTRGTFSVDPADGQGRAGGRPRSLVGLLLVALLLAIGAAAAAWWFLWRAVPVLPPQGVAPVALPIAAAASAPALPAASSAATAATVSASAPTAAVSAVATASAPLIVQPAASAAQITPQPVPTASAPVVAAAVPAAVASRPTAGAVPAIPVPPMPEPVAVPASPKASAAVAAAPAVPTSSASAKPASAATPAKPASPMAATARPAPTKPESAALVAAAPAARSAQAAAMETLAQAQGLWNAGSREQAQETLREAVAAAERSNLAAQPGGLASFVMLVRELCRMELAEGHTAQVMALLTRLEPVLAEQADIWALRGNAAQRLGRHPESAAAYLAALKLRPGEPRWMLGAAVSLAAQGQTTAAAEWADKARAAGVVSPEVLNYLRQMGVPLR